MRKIESYAKWKKQPGTEIMAIAGELFAPK